MYSLCGVAYKEDAVCAFVDFVMMAESLSGTIVRTVTVIYNSIVKIKILLYSLKI